MRNIIDQLIEYGEVRGGQLGVMIQDVTFELAEVMDIKQTAGTVITQVIEGSVADKVGLKVGDVVIAINDKIVHGLSSLRNVVGLLRVGRLEIRRDGRKLRIFAVL
ncbi:MAG: PDZ domain-containing protein [Gammaproteobacteria bacterium]|nr:PDZ domain-containing protein [Gammaproteobacteria bacterium]